MLVEVGLVAWTGIWIRFGADETRAAVVGVCLLIGGIGMSRGRWTVIWIA